MRTKCQSTLFACLLVVGHQTLAATAPAPASWRTMPTPVNQTRTRVASIRETAQLQGITVVVEWRHDGSVVVHCPDFSQFIWCQGDTLHVRFEEPAGRADH